MRKRRRVIPSRWSSAQARAEGSLSLREQQPTSEVPLTENAGTGCFRTRPLYEAEEAARER